MGSKGVLYSSTKELTFEMFTQSVIPFTLKCRLSIYCLYSDDLSSVDCANADEINFKAIRQKIYLTDPVE